MDNSVCIAEWHNDSSDDGGYEASFYIFRKFATVSIEDCDCHMTKADAIDLAKKILAAYGEVV